jgi:predicted nuclease of predicted toxin-antitoxin system
MIKLYLDEDITPVLARVLRDRGFNVASALELGHSSWDDEAHLEYASSEGRTLLTYNIRHFAGLHKKWQSAGKIHEGIILSPQFSREQFGELLR